MLYKGYTPVDRLYLGNTEKTRVWAGNELIWDRALDRFAENVVADGGTVEWDTLKSFWDAQIPYTREHSKYLLLPGAYKPGIIYAMQTQNGAIEPITFSRPTVATYTDKNGIMQTAAANVPRIDWDPITQKCLGYMAEKVETNYTQTSNYFPETSGWTNVTSDAANYRGVSYASGDGNGNQAYKGVNGTMPVGTITISCFWHCVSGLRRFGVFVNGTGTGYIRYNVDTGLMEGSNTSTYSHSFGKQDLGNGYYRVWVTVHNFDGDIARIGYMGTGTYRLAEANFTLAGHVTTTITTGASQVTRAEDTLVTQKDWLNNGDTTLYMDGTSLSGGEYTMFSRNNGVAGRFWYGSITDNIALRDNVGGNTINRNAYYTSNQPSKAVGSYGQAGIKLCVNGSPLASNPYSGIFGGSSVNRLAHSANSAGRIRAYIRAFAVFHRQLSDAQLIALSQP